MKELNYEITIAAPPEKVWQILWNDESYRRWTSVFDEGSHAESDWREGSRVRFLTAKGDGMYSLIEKCVPERQMTFRHLGEIKDGVEKPFNAEMQGYADSYESYFLRSGDGQTRLSVEMVGIPEDFVGFFNEVFPKALAIVKDLSEN